MIDTDEMQRLAQVLGGGWRVEHGVMPVVVLTMMEAQALEKKIIPTPIPEDAQWA